MAAEVTTLTAQVRYGLAIAALGELADSHATDSGQGPSTMNTLTLTGVLAKDLQTDVVHADCASPPCNPIFNGFNATGSLSHGVVGGSSICKPDDDHGVIAVEGKVAEDFDRLVSDWLPTTKTGATDRLPVLCKVLGLSVHAAHPLRYQLLHPTVAALFEAERYQATHALMLVHSFCTNAKADHFHDYWAFGTALGFSNLERNSLSEARQFAEVGLRLGWVADNPGN